MMDLDWPQRLCPRSGLQVRSRPEARNAAAKGPSGGRRRVNLGHIYEKRRFAIADPHDIQKRLLSRSVFYDFVVGCPPMIDRRRADN